MYCYRCGEWKTRRVCPTCGADESRRAEARTAEGKALRMLFDLQEAGPARTIGDAQAFASYLTDLLPGEANELFRQQLVMIVGYYDVRVLLQEQLRSRTAPDSAAYAELCGRAEKTGFAPSTCRKAIGVLYEMIGWEIPPQQTQLQPKPAAQPKPAPLPQPAVAVGSIVHFGRYPQTAAGTDMTPIEWIVLDVRGNKALLLSRYGLDVKPYHLKYQTVTWEQCTLRSWLNGEFLLRAFTTREQTAILVTIVNNDRSQGFSGWFSSGGDNTQNRIFLLSYAEANKYFHVTHDDNVRARLQPTAYALKEGAWTNSDFKTAWWWLRSPGTDQYYAAIVNSAGFLYDKFVDTDNGCVRPAMWVDLNSDIFHF